MQFCFVETKLKILLPTISSSTMVYKFYRQRKMTTLSCPLCLGVNFPSEETLLYNLISSSTQRIRCPRCDETLLGFDKFTVHLCSHILKCDSSPAINLRVGVDSTLAHIDKKLESIRLDGGGNGIKTFAPSQNASKYGYNGDGDVDVEKSSTAEKSNIDNSLVDELDVRVFSDCVSAQPTPSGNDAFDDIVGETETLSVLENVAEDSIFNIVLSSPSTDRKLIKSAFDTKNEFVSLVDHLRDLSERVDRTGAERGSETVTNKDEGHRTSTVVVQSGNAIDLPKLDDEDIIKMNYSSFVNCDICSTVLPEDDDIKRLHHELVHDGGYSSTSKYNCARCKRKFKIKGSLAIHERLANCGKSTAVTSNWMNEETSSYRCNICSKTFKKENNLNQHLKTHDEKKWTCDNCGKLFSTKYFLQRHKRLHTGETPYVCPICQKQFTFQQTYHKHIVYHNSEKPYSCKECGKSFKELSTLYNHQRIHTGEKPYSCDVCGKHFRQKVSCLIHSRIHTGLKPFKCSVCQKSFRYKVSLRNHKCSAESILIDRHIDEKIEETAVSVVEQTYYASNAKI